MLYVTWFIIIIIRGYKYYTYIQQIMVQLIDMKFY